MAPPLHPAEAAEAAAAEVAAAEVAAAEVAAAAAEVRAAAEARRSPPSGIRRARCGTGRSGIEKQLAER
jgi:hypothetical protein